MSMTILRNLLFISGFMRCMKSHSGCRRMRKAAERWCDSLGDLSLLLIAHSSTVLIRKSLLNPRCSKSAVVPLRRGFGRLVARRHVGT